jgi:hypothetical protein
MLSLTTSKLILLCNLILLNEPCMHQLMLMIPSQMRNC